MRKRARLFSIGAGAGGDGVFACRAAERRLAFFQARIARLKKW
jgi:hypothetical protein